MQLSDLQLTDTYNEWRGTIVPLHGDYFLRVWLAPKGGYVFVVAQGPRSRPAAVSVWPAGFFAGPSTGYDPLVAQCMLTDIIKNPDSYLGE